MSALDHRQNSTLRLSKPKTTAWAPQPGPQHALVKCPLGVVFYGGARGGGKTDGVLGKWAAKEARYGRHFNASAFRLSTVAFEDAIDRSHEIFGPLGGKFVASPRPRWRMPNGGRVSFEYLENVQDARSQQGRNITDAWIEEVGQYADAQPIDMLNGALRSAHGVPTQMVLTGNPGGAGQHWIAGRFGLIPFPKGPKVVEYGIAGGRTVRAAVIPSRLEDNQILMRKDPGYEDRLYMVGNEALVRAWREGDWSAIEGAFFTEWSNRNIVEPFAIPEHWQRLRSYDHGYAAPFSVGWWALASDDHKGIPRGALVRYREWYGAAGPNKGVRMAAEEIGAGIREREAGEDITDSVADPSIFASAGGPTIAERVGCGFRRADNKRVGVRGALGGWDMMRARIKGEHRKPMLYVFRTCEAFIRTVPVLQHDAKKAEDLDTTQEDHVADEARYACMSRPWLPDEPAPPPEPSDPWDDDEEVDLWKVA